MPSFASTVALMAFASQALAAHLTFTTPKTEIFAGEPFTFTWSGEPEGKVTITLLNADDSESLVFAEGITESGENGEFTWTPSEDLPSGTYAFEIKDESADEPNYSATFAYDSEASSSSSDDADNTTTAPIPTITGSPTGGNLTATTGNFTRTSTSSSAKETETNTRTSSADTEETTGDVETVTEDSAAGRMGMSVAVLAGIVGTGLFALV